MGEVTQWTDGDANGNDFGQEEHCPNWRCGTRRTFEGQMGRDANGEIVDVRYECEECGTSIEEARSHNMQEADKHADPSETERRSN